MRYINVRQLQRDLEEATRELPVIVTKLGQPIFTIIPMGSGITPEGTVADLRGGRFKGEIEEYLPDKKTKTAPIRSAEHLEPKKPNPVEIPPEINTMGYCAFPFCHKSAVVEQEGKLYCKEHK